MTPTRIRPAPHEPRRTQVAGAGPTGPAFAPSRPLPHSPPIVAGESFASWTDRIAHANRLPRSLILERLGVSSTNQNGRAPATFGLTLTEPQIEQVQHATGAPADAIRASLLSRYDNGPLDLTGLNGPAVKSVSDVTRNQWLHVTHSNYCPDCLRESNGVWPLGWRLPWTFACLRHRLLLNSTCPGCQQPAARGRADRTARPNFLDLVPVPEQCGSSMPGTAVGYAGRPGRAARPCDHNLADTLATPLLLEHTQPTLTAQARLTAMLAQSGTREPWQDLRAAVSVLMHFTDPDVLLALAPDLAEAALHIPGVTEALTDHEQQRQARADINERVRQGGRDHRTGVRQRHATTTPRSPALMAALTPIALHLLDAEGQPALERLAARARQRHQQITALLRAAGANPSLLEAAHKAERATGRFTHALARTTPTGLDPSRVPAYLPETDAAPFLACLPGTRPDTARKFAAIHIVRTLTGDTWTEAAVRLGHPTRGLPTLTANVVNRITQAGTRPAWQTATDNYLTALTTRPTVDYAARRQHLRHLRAVPASILHAAGQPVATESRQSNSAAWLWAHLTGGHPHHAPAWGNNPATPNQREVYKRFIRGQLPLLRTALIGYGEQQLAARTSELAGTTTAA